MKSRLPRGRPLKVSPEVVGPERGDHYAFELRPSIQEVEHIVTSFAVGRGATRLVAPGAHAHRRELCAAAHRVPSDEHEVNTHESLRPRGFYLMTFCFDIEASNPSHLNRRSDPDTSRGRQIIQLFC